MIHVYLVRFKGNNLDSILPIMFDEGTDLQDLQKDLEYFDERIVYRKFDLFRTKINKGYVPK